MGIGCIEQREGAREVMGQSAFTAFASFSRYRSIVDDWHAFLETLARPLPTVIWANTLRILPEALASLLAEEGIDVTPLSWYPGAFRVAPGARPGRTWAYKVGLFHIQEEVSLLPVVLLDPHPNERILDLCAAPGSKTAQMAVRLGNQGTIIANDIGFDRMRALRHVLERLGVVNVSTLVRDGANLPRAVGMFDRILVDAPCSCEGTSRKNPEVLGTCGLGFSLQHQGVQKALLRKAVQLCRPGGRIVYATCTYAPEENEAVVDAILTEFGDERVRMLPAQVPGFRTAPALTEWNGQRFHPSLERAIRVWPHHNDTGGFFIAVLEKLGDDAEAALPPPVETSWSEWVVDPAPWLAVLEERFGFPPEAFAEYTFLKPGKKGLYLVPRGHIPPPREMVDAVGLLFMHTKGKYPKLTTAAAMTFGHLATRNVIQLNAAQRDAYLARENIPLTREQRDMCTGPGFVLLRYRDYILGTGFCRVTPGGIYVESLFPKGWMRG